MVWFGLEGSKSRAVGIELLGKLETGKIRLQSDKVGRVGGQRVAHPYLI